MSEAKITPTQYISLYGELKSAKGLEAVLHAYVSENLHTIESLRSSSSVDDYSILMQINAYELEVNIAQAAIENWKKEKKYYE